MPIAMPSAASEPALFFARALLPDGWARDVRIVRAGGRIAAVEREAAPQGGDERHACALPGLPNLHSHAFQRGMAGLAERRGPGDDSFWTWRDIMYRFVDRMTPDDLRALAGLAYVEMLESGFTRVGEFHYLHHDRGGAPYADPAEMSASIAAAAEETGIGLTLLPVAYRYAGFGGQPPRPDQARFITGPDAFAALFAGAERAVAHLPEGRIGLAPHSLRAVGPDDLQRLAALAGDRPIHIHIAEQVPEVEQCRAWSGARPVAWLMDHAPVDARWCLVHATHMDAVETAALARSNAVAGLCPVTEANLGDGLFPAEAFLAAGGRFGVGSDSNVRIDAPEELRLLEYGQRLMRQGRNLFARGPGRSTGADLYAAAVAGGAQALGAPGLAGLAAGESADIVSLDTGHPSLIGRTDDGWIDALLFSAGRAAIDCVWRYGVKQVRAGRHIARDRIVRRYGAVLEKMTA